MQATSLSGLHWTNFLCEAVMRQFSVSLWVQGPVAVVFAPRITVDPTPRIYSRVPTEVPSYSAGH